MPTPSPAGRRFRLLKSAPLSLALITTITLNMSLAHADVASITTRTYDIPAGPLGSSLNRFAQ